MAYSQRGRAVADGVKRSAEARTCESCGRKGAIVERIYPEMLIRYCHWAHRGKCTRPDDIRT